MFSTGALQVWAARAKAGKTCSRLCVDTEGCQYALVLLESHTAGPNGKERVSSQASPIESDNMFPRHRAGILFVKCLVEGRR